MEAGEAKNSAVRQPQVRKKLGEIFVRRGLMTPVTVDRLVGLSQRVGRRFGAVLEELGIVTGEELADALAEQYGVRVVKGFSSYKFPQQLLDLVPVESAVEQCMFPLKVERGVLAIAISDPTNLKIATNIAANQRMRLIPFVATRHEIHSAISRHYLKREPSLDDRKRVLLVESDKVLRTMLRTCLGLEGYLVEEAEDGMEAFKSVISVKPDIIVTERDAPKLNGQMLLESVRRLPEMTRTPVLLMSPHATAEDEAAAFEKGFFDFIPKPVKEPTLRVKVRRALGSTGLV